MGIFKRKRGDADQPGGQQDWGEFIAQRLPPEVRDAYRQAAGQDAARREAAAKQDHFAESLERIPNQPAPPGKARGVAKMVAGEQERAERSEGGPTRPSEYWRGVVLEVHVPGRAPYQVEMGTVHVKRYDVLEAGYPVLVDQSDPQSLEILFDEMPEMEAAAGQRVQESFQAATSSLGAAEGEALLASLNAVTDPKQRKQLAERLRAMGYEVPPGAE